MGADEIAALAERLARQADRFLVVAADILAIGGDTVIDRGKGIARREPQGLARGAIALLPAPAIRQRDTIKTARGREIRIEPKRQLELGDAIVKTAIEQIDAGERIMRPRILAVGADRRQRRVFRDGNGFRHLLPAHMGGETCGRPPAG